ncbi:LytR/AlgR family response regulator transcription factor [Vagococcus fluvialis]|uniref:LytR/AlgR family response regulator transcription factor n=1 Tax=Vagococcus fluvialis TaxID=2738 RepID=UPI003B5CB508
MIPIFICEDNVIQKENLETIIYKKILIEEYDMKIVESVTSPDRIIDYINNNKNIDGIYFLDIDLNNEINGIQLGSMIREKDPNAKIIFITTHSELLQLTFEYKLEALDYILKDSSSAVVETKIVECLEIANSYYLSEKVDNPNKIKLKIGNITKLFLLEDIMFVETTGTPHKIKIHLANGELELYGVLSDIEELSSDFVRVHKSIIINQNSIDYIDRKRKVIVMTNGETCGVSVRGLKKIINS